MNLLNLAPEFQESLVNLHPFEAGKDVLNEQADSSNLRGLQLEAPTAGMDSTGNESAID
jgi:hypothetical protein